MCYLEIKGDVLWKGLRFRKLTNLISNSISTAQMHFQGLMKLNHLAFQILELPESLHFRISRDGEIRWRTKGKSEGFHPNQTPFPQFFTTLLAYNLLNFPILFVPTSSGLSSSSAVYGGCFTLYRA